MVDPVNLNVPGLPYLLFALVFFAVVLLFVGVLSLIEVAIQHHQRSNADASDGDADSDDAHPTDDDRAVLRVDRLFGAVRDAASAESRSETTVYKCRHCGTTLDASDDRCPHCETPTVARYEVG